MRALTGTPWMYPAAHIFRIKSGICSETPETLHFPESEDARLADGKTAPPLVMVATGNVADERDVQAVIQLAGQQDAMTLKVAVMSSLSIADWQSKQRAYTIWSELRKVFDGLLLATENSIDDVARRAARAIITPGSAGQHAGCDWNDMRSIVGGHKNLNPDRYGFGRGQGAQRAEQAALAAFHQCGQASEHTSPQGICCTIAAPRNLLGREIREIGKLIRNQFPDAQTPVSAVAYDESMGEDVVEVDIFVFG